MSRIPANRAMAILLFRYETGAEGAACPLARFSPLDRPAPAAPCRAGVLGMEARMAGARFSQINLVVRDMQASLAFYRRLGLDIPEEAVWGTGSGPHHAQAATSGE